ncbi:MAG: Rv1678 family membrane protein [Marmoricola sp.]
MTRSPLDRAALALGVGGVLSDVFWLSTSSNNNFVLVQGLALVVFPVLGAVGIAGGLSGRRTLVVAAGTGYVVAALIQLFQFGRSTNWLAGNGSTFVLFAAWGVGLLVVGCTARPDPPADDNAAE